MSTASLPRNRIVTTGRARSRHAARRRRHLVLEGLRGLVLVEEPGHLGPPGHLDARPPDRVRRRALDHRELQPHLGARAHALEDEVPTQRRGPGPCPSTEHSTPSRSTQRGIRTAIVRAVLFLSTTFPSYGRWLSTSSQGEARLRSRFTCAAPPRDLTMPSQAW